jgi:hypothetical protein
VPPPAGGDSRRAGRLGLSRADGVPNLTRRFQAQLKAQPELLNDVEEILRQDPPGTTTFECLGFTHYWGRSRKGESVVNRKTAKSRFKRALEALSEWCRKHLHLPVREQH